MDLLRDLFGIDVGHCSTSALAPVPSQSKHKKQTDSAKLTETLALIPRFTLLGRGSSQVERNRKILTASKVSANCFSVSFAESPSRQVNYELWTDDVRRASAFLTDTVACCCRCVVQYSVESNFLFEVPWFGRDKLAATLERTLSHASLIRWNVTVVDAENTKEETNANTEQAERKKCV